MEQGQTEPAAQREVREGPDSHPEPAPPGRNGRRLPRWFFPVIGGVVLIAVIAVVSVLVVLFLREMGQPGEITAKFLPRNTQVYFTINLRPGMNQIERGLKINSILKLASMEVI